MTNGNAQSEALRLVFRFPPSIQNLLFNTVRKIFDQCSAVGGALVGALVAYLVARQQFKATVLSKNRQEWINKLRDFLAEYEAILYNVYADFNLGGVLRSKDEGLSDLRRANLILSQVKLMINPKEDDHVALVALMHELHNAATYNQDQKSKEFAKFDEEYVTLSQSILKREWERVKKGQ